MIELKGISRIYKPKKSEAVHALNKVDLVFEKTGMVFILGKSGSGKSTFLNVVGGLDKYNEGNLIIKDKSTQDFKQSDFDSYRNTMIGFIFQEYNLLDEFTVAQNIGLALELQGKKASSEKINEILAAVDLENYGRRKPNELSVGQKQRVAIARALVKDPEIIMADEPTGALDSVTGRQVLETLEKLSKSRLVIVVSHDREFAETYASRIIEFKDGYIISDVTKEKSTENITSNINFSDYFIEVKEGYTLSLEDLELINKYLKENSKTSKIKKTAHKSYFKPTEKEKLVKSNEQYHSIKSKLPFKSSLKIGASSLKHKTVRLIFAIILAAISFAMFGLADTMSSYNKYTATTSSIIDSDINYVSLTKAKATTVDNWTYFSEKSLNLEDFTLLNNEYPNLHFKPVYRSRFVDFDYSRSLAESPSYEESLYYVRKYSGLSEINNQDLTAYDMELLGNSRLPTSDNEVVITKYSYEMFKKFAYKDSTNTKILINNYNDLLGKKLYWSEDLSFTIVGIVDTKFNTTRFEILMDPESPRNILTYLMMNEYNTVLTYSQHNLLYVNSGYLERNVKDYGIYMYDIEGSIFLKYGEESEIYSEFINKKSKYQNTDLQYFKTVNDGNIQKNDIIISEQLLANLRYDIYSDFTEALDNHIASFIETISLDKIEQGLKVFPDYKDIAASNTWDEEELSLYREIFRYIYYSVDSLPHSYGKSYEELSNEVKVPFFSNLNPFNIKLNYYSWRDDTNNSNETIRVVGILNNRDINKNRLTVLVLTDDYFDDFNFEESGIYSSAISSINVNDHSLITKLVKGHYHEEGIVYHYQNEITATLDQVNELIEGLAHVFVYIGVVFAVFSSLLLLNYITTSVSYKKKEIGILRAIGARGLDVVGIFSKEATIIALINFTIALIMVVATVVAINFQFRNNYGILITILTFGVRQIFLMLAISLFVGLISSIIPVLRIARKRPIDAIRDK